MGIEECSGGRDDDGDGDIDCDDSDCSSLEECNVGECGDVTPGGGEMGDACRTDTNCISNRCCTSADECDARNVCTCRR